METTSEKKDVEEENVILYDEINREISATVVLSETANGDEHEEEVRCFFSTVGLKR
jgi:hypothetical protein